MSGLFGAGFGLDLASVRTKAVRDGDHYVVNGHKTWTTLAQHCRLDFLPGADRSRRQNRRPVSPSC